jgi:hypothetical protein
VEDRRVINRYVEAFHQQFPEAEKKKGDGLSFLAGK